MPNTAINKTLSICIPTYNRPNFIKQQLEKIIPIAETYKINIYISDNSDNFETQKVIESFNSEFVIYDLNNYNIHDRNFLKVVQMPVSKYRWLLSDSNYFDEDLLKTILAKCEPNIYDYIFLNSGRVKDISDDRIYEDSNILLAELGWHLTHISSIIYSEIVFNNIPYINRYLNTNFIHHAIIFEHWNSIKTKGIFISSPIYKSLNIKKTNTWTDIYQLWIIKWTSYIMSLPTELDLKNKLKCIKDHGVKTRLLSFIGFCILRSTNDYNTKIFCKYFKYLRLITNTHPLILFIISITPIFIFQFALYIYKNLH